MKREQVLAVALALAILTWTGVAAVRADPPLRRGMAPPPGMETSKGSAPDGRHDDLGNGRHRAIIHAISSAQDDVAELYPVGDAYVDHQAPNQNYGSEDLLAVQYWSSSPKTDPAKRRSFVGFDLSSVPAGAIVTEATFWAYMVDASGRAKGADVALRRITESWSESTITWYGQPSSKAYSSQSLGTTPGWRSWDVTTLVDTYWKGRKFGKGSNHGLGLCGPESGTQYYRWFHSSDDKGTSYDPKLEVHYTLPTATPTATPVPWTFTGNVYDGELGDTTWPLEGVTVQLYEMGVPTNLLDTDVTDKGGGFSLMTSQQPAYDFHIVASDLPGYVSTGAIAGDEGTVVDANTISYFYMIERGTYGGNLFFDQPEATETPTPTSSPTATSTPILTPTATPTDLPTATSTPILTPTATSTPTVTPTPTPTATLPACPVPLEGVSISGPFTVTAGVPFTLLAEVSPIDATEPITYSWTPDPAAGQGTDQAQYLWEATGVFTAHLEAENCGGRDTDDRVVTVMEPRLPDLLITDVWEEAGEIWYQMMNAGGTTAPAGHATRLQVDGVEEPGGSHTIDTALAPGDRLRRSFELNWTCTPPEDVITVCADDEADVDEEDEENNCHEETWPCDTTAPQITYGPAVSSTTTTEAVIVWGTNEESNSVVQYARKTGAYDLEERDDDLVQEHTVTLSGLEPATVYRYVVQSTDASGNVVASDRHFFETLPPPDDEPPIITDVRIDKLAGFSDYYQIIASASDNVGLASVTFYLDDEPLGTDYAPPYRALFHPLQLGLKREEFFTEHEVRAVATDVRDAQRPWEEAWTPDYALTGMTSGFIAPSVSPYEIGIGSGVVPEGTKVFIQVFVAEHYSADCTNTLWGCIPGQAGTTEGPTSPTQTTDPCEEVCEMDVGVRTVNFYVNDEPKYMSHYDEDEVPLTHSYEWDVSGLGPGTHTITAWFVDSDGEVRQVSGSPVVEIVRSVPDLQVEREVTRDGNTFNMALTVTNRGTRPAEIWRVEDNLIGFQVIEESVGGDYQVHLDDDTHATQTDVLISLCCPPEALEPGDSVTVEYSAVPILHPLLAPTTHAIGVNDVSVTYWDGFEEREKGVELLCRVTSDGEPLAQAVAAAQRAADYLLVTDPTNLYQYNSIRSVNTLLSKMAELARLKSGILGYTNGVSASRTKELIDQWGSQMMGSHGAAGGYSWNGYLLIVGEAEIVPSFTVGWGSHSVSATDSEYADTGGHPFDPELMVGRIIGNSASLLTIPLETSINVESGAPGASFDRSHALVVSGWPACREGCCCHIDFAHQANLVAGRLEAQGVDVRILDNTLYPTPEDEVNAFFNLAPGRDIIHLAAHGGASSLDSLNTYNFDRGSAPFGDANPFVYGSSCLTGDYLMGRSLAEAFLQSHAGAYLGSTEISKGATNTAMADWFYENWGAGQSVGHALTEMKRTTTGDAADLWAVEYQLFGDPKYGLGAGLPGPTVARNETTALAEPPSSIDVVVPSYEVTTTAMGDYVSIPGGFKMLEPGKPMVPLYSTSVPYPKGTRVQDVILTDRSGLSESTGISLTTFVPTPAGLSAVGATGAGTDAGWWPDETFTWSVDEVPDGSSELRIEIYPFVYNTRTTDVRFYQNYSFDIETVTSTVEINYLITDQDAYPQGDDVHIELGLENTGAVQDVIVEAVVKRSFSSQVVDGLPLRSLDDFGGKASFAMDWDTEGFEPGWYAVEVRALDRDGNVLHTATEQLRVGIYAGEITAFSATPDTFLAGDVVNTTLVFSNTGTVPITGTAVVEIKASDGDVVETFRHDFEGLAVAETIGVENEWDTSEMPPDAYTVLGYVMYDARATEPRSVVVSNQSRVYLPLVLRDG